MMRADTSVALPAVTGTTIRTGFDGQLCAEAAETPAPVIAIAMPTSQRCRMSPSRN